MLRLNRYTFRDDTLYNCIQIQPMLRLNFCRSAGKFSAVYIQIQPMLRLNLVIFSTASNAIRIQIQPMLRLNIF